ncbi:aldose 1-epimerase [Aeromonas hydrophila]|uniref:aldose 1-epimerase n=1 Tax=Aeromonas hydrophila TaxID=644 RepID=UPI002361A0A2|nr:aldose 1-epimerase [Aeromonas hydrophila]WDA23117.1 aldose 1-epimerase [Aeromonas hydrophila]WES93180.1 aldose 1-epimerase [Aeromonas hydrophila]
MTVYTLSNPHLRMRVSTQGACVLELEDEQGRPLLRDSDPDAPYDPGQWHPGESALFPMVPLANRVAGNRFELWGKEHGLPESPVDPDFFLHGDGWLLPWQRVAGSASSVTLQLASQCGPFHYLAEIDYRLQGVSLLARVSLTHLGESPCLYGAGFHPFFWRDEQTKIRFLASGVWQEGADHLPTDWSSRLAPHLDFRQWQRSQGWLNHCYGGWHGTAELVHPTRQQRLKVVSDASFLMLYQPDETSGFICLEPQSHAANAHHLAGHPGLRLLQRGDTMSIVMTITLMPALIDGCQA